MWFSGSSENLVVFIAVHFISELNGLSQFLSVIMSI